MRGTHAGSRRPGCATYQGKRAHTFHIPSGSIAEPLAAIFIRLTLAHTVRRPFALASTGVATSGLYVLCDGAARCDVRLHNTSLRHNRLLWQAALEPGDLQGGAVSPYDDTGLQLFRRVMPWLTYTYPLMYIWGGVSRSMAVALGGAVGVAVGVRADEE